MSKEMHIMIDQGINQGTYKENTNLYKKFKMLYPREKPKYLASYEYLPRIECQTSLRKMKGAC